VFVERTSQVRYTTYQSDIGKDAVLEVNSIEGFGVDDVHGAGCFKTSVSTRNQYLEQPRERVTLNLLQEDPVVVVDHAVDLGVAGVGP
jgi:hypothetical protein